MGKKMGTKGSELILLEDAVKILGLFEGASVEIRFEYRKGVDTPLIRRRQHVGFLVELKGGRAHIEIAEDIHRRISEKTSAPKPGTAVHIFLSPEADEYGFHPLINAQIRRWDG